jgi:hypothetical protein
MSLNCKEVFVHAIHGVENKGIRMVEYAVMDILAFVPKTIHDLK